MRLLDIRFSSRVYRSSLSRLLCSSSSSAESVTIITQDEEKFQNEYRNVPTENIRNFSIIAHVDHGKSTLADRILEITGNISSDDDNTQVLDSLQVEKERGITVKAQTASMLYTAENGERYLLQLIDTPGHVDFQYEVSRALMACQGALLLVDSSQGVQAQTLATNRAAAALGLKILPVLTKIDLPHSDPDRCVDQLIGLCDNVDVDPDSILMTSGKTGDGVEDVLEAIVQLIPPPNVDSSSSKPLQALLFDSWYDEYRGVIMLVQILQGSLFETQKIRLLNGNKEVIVNEVGVLTPAPKRLKQDRSVSEGRVAYLVSTGLREPRDARAGDTLCDAVLFGKDPDAVPMLPGFEPAIPMVFASVYPVDNTDFDVLTSAISRLQLTDTSISVSRESNMALGLGFRCGFLGLLHMDVFTQRLFQEHNCDVIITAPSVPYRVNLKDFKNTEVERITVESAADLPTGNEVVSYEQPMVLVTVVAPSDCLGDLMTMLQRRDGTQHDLAFVSGVDQVMMKYEMPWREVVMDLYDEIKSLSSGYASLEYEDLGFREADLRRVDILINQERVDVLSLVASKEKAQSEGRKMCLRLKSVLPRQQFEVNIQAAIGNKIVAKERIPPFRKNVLVKSGKTVGGGDQTRKQKLLKKQKEGKKRMKTVGKVTLTQDAFLAVVKR